MEEEPEESHKDFEVKLNAILKTYRDEEQIKRIRNYYLFSDLQANSVFDLAIKRAGLDNLVDHVTLSTEDKAVLRQMIYSDDQENILVAQQIIDQTIKPDEPKGPNV